MVQNQNKSVPELRFKGFSDAWVQRKVSDLAEDTFGGGTPKTSVPEFWEGDLPWIQSSDLVQDDVLNEYSTKLISAEAVKNSAAKRIPGGSIAVVTRVGVGKLALVNTEYATSQDFLSLSDLTGDTKFTLYLLYRLLKNEAANAQGTSIKGITKADLLNKVISLPTNEDEQQNVGELFESLDKLIAANQRKVDALKNQKFAYLERIFNQKLRFGGFTEPWVQRNLGEVVDVKSGRDYKHLSEGDIPVYGTGGYMLSVDEALSQNDDAIGIGRKGTIDNPYLLRAPFWTVDTLFYAIPRVGFDLNFTFDIFQKVNWRKLDESTGVPSLSKATINSVSTAVPSEDEQIKIGGLFEKIDNLIAANQKKVDALTKQKSAYLQKIFI
ncbi:restriction endonuclease subunit S [Weissella cibaria]|uniref:restriction endonuclease subunit S n=1 Tax=Weissella cibaria TaxID=137591 RepID=UPI00106E3ABE|nr:restriction endonuclease subunit S [Weissella cibaria]